MVPLIPNFPGTTWVAIVFTHFLQATDCTHVNWKFCSILDSPGCSGANYTHGSLAVRYVKGNRARTSQHLPYYEIVPDRSWGHAPSEIPNTVPLPNHMHTCTADMHACVRACTHTHTFFIFSTVMIHYGALKALQKKQQKQQQNQNFNTVFPNLTDCRNNIMFFS